MELVGAISAREWNSLNGIFSADHQGSNHDDHRFIEGQNFLSDFAVQNHHHHLGTTNGASSLEFPFSICTYEGDESYSYSAYSNDCQPVSWVTSNNSVSLCEPNVIAMANTDLYLNIEGDHDHHSCLNQEVINKSNFGDGLPAISKKRSRTAQKTSSEYDQGLKSKRNVKPRKTRKLVSSDVEEDGNVGKKLPFSPDSSSSAEENSNVFHEELGGMASSSSPKGSSTALNSNGKARASRGSATDPQSLYARKRREKINERLRVLQGLVPNGTKVDISTMLEEAVQYVKFLQLQIKILSSDDLWMYAPLAYNGKNIGIDLSLAVSRQD